MQRRTSKDACTTTVTSMEAKSRALAASASGYALLEHTADVGVTAWGPEPGAAFAAAARGMYAIMLGGEPSDRPGPKTERTVTVTGDSWHDLLVNWLAEFLFLISVEDVVAQEYEFASCAPPHCSAKVTGILLEDSEMSGICEIKAVTYHQLKVEIKPNHTHVQVVFDI